MKLILISFLLFPCYLLVGQITYTDDNVFYDILPGDNFFSTPDVTAFQKHNMLPVNLYTGRVNIDLPLYSVTDGNINVPISISYNSGGVKVDDIASNVGLGWNLNASGSVVRIIKDIDDHEMGYATFGEIDWDYGVINYYYPSIKGYFRDYDDFIQTGPTGHSLYQGYELMAKEDAAPDLFMANAPGFSSKFILEKVTNGFDILPIDGSGVISESLITRTSDGTQSLGFTFGELGFTNGFCGIPSTENWLDMRGYTDYKEFKLINTNGLKYRFSLKDIYETMPRRWTYGCFTGGNTMFRSHKIDVSAWHLTSIADPSTNAYVSFDYEQYSKPTIQYQKSIIETSLIHDADPESTDPVFGHIPLFNSYFNSSNNQLDEKFFKSQLNYLKQTKANRLTKINFSGGEVEFIYNHIRQDTNEEKALTEIRVKDEFDNVVTKFVFHYSYFLSKEGCNEPRCKRLKLNKVEQIGNDGGSFDLYSFEYDYTNPLPKVHSLQQDFLGYYNNNGVVTPDYESVISKKPTLYYHKDKGKNSILPFQLAGGFTKTISGDFSLQSNNFSLSGLLTKVEYATKGKSEFEYETHTFNLLGNQYIAGGARIKKQKLTDGQGDLKVFDYEYLDDQNNPSGYINKMPVYGYPLAWDQDKPSNNVSFVVYDKNRTALEITNGSFVGYSQVKEIQQGAGYKVHKYFSPQHFPNEDEVYQSGGCACAYNPSLAAAGLNFLRNNSAFPSSHYVDNDILRGMPSQLKVYNQSDNLLQKIDFTYLRDIFNTINFTYRDKISTYGGMDGTSPEYQWELYHTSKLNIERKLLIEEEQTDYYGSQSKTISKTYDYDSSRPLLIEQKLVDENLIELKTNFFYPDDSEVSNLPYMSNLRSQNRYTERIKEKKFRDNLLLYTGLKGYAHFGNGLFDTKTSLNSKGAFTPEERQIIDQRDGSGNIKEYHNKDGIYYSILWGYNNMYPVALIKNKRYDDLPQTLVYQILSLTNVEDEPGLISRLQELRDHPTMTDVEIVTYTYRRLIGINTITDERGYTTYYEYDEFNRLKHVKDREGNILSQYQYNYKNN
ncbi:RHS repeat domain-containing protein [uncultured Planktosalinus sp.]|uniref:RHS repeat domain-containing protein n=1 Tax=uncultured Planktosalinus sp. TaxID=1810935 RepID=UPI0030DC2E44